MLCLCVPAKAADPNGVGFAGWVMGNNEMLHARIGVAKQNVEWGFSALHFPAKDDTEASYALGFWGAINTPNIGLLQPGQIPPFWGGLSVQGFADVDVDWDFENDKAIIMPGAGIRVEPSKTMSLIARIAYPMGDHGTSVDLNSVQGTLGLAIRWP